MAKLTVWQNGSSTTTELSSPGTAFEQLEDFYAFVGEGHTVFVNRGAERIELELTPEELHRQREAELQKEVAELRDANRRLERFNRPLFNIQTDVNEGDALIDESSSRVFDFVRRHFRRGSC